MTILVLQMSLTRIYVTHGYLHYWQAQYDMEALKAEKERSDEEKQRIAKQLQQQLMELQTHYQVWHCSFSILEFKMFGSEI